MPETISPPDRTEDEKQSFRVERMHHPSLHHPDLDSAEAWFERVFGCTSRSIGEVLEHVPRVIDYWPKNYLIYTLIKDVFFGSVNPALFTGDDGKPHHPQIENPHLVDLGWSVENQINAFRKVKDDGFTLTNSIGEIQEGDEPIGPNVPTPFFTQPDETGLRYHFYPGGPFPLDPRSEPGWTLPPVSPEDPLALERCSHHTILTRDPTRVLKLYVDELGGSVIHAGRNDLLGADSTYVHIAESTLEFAVPDAGTAADAELTGKDPKDSFHSVTWKTVDLARAERHLEQNDVKIAVRTEDVIVTDPATSIGVPWGFTTSLVPGDPRGA